MTTHELVNKRYSEIQTLLRDKHAAEGRGIGEMVRSVENKLTPTLSWELRAIAHIRNQVVHEGLAVIPRYFEPLCKEAIAKLKGVKAKATTVRETATAKPKSAAPRKAAKAKPKSAKQKTSKESAPRKKRASTGSGLSWL